MENTPFKHIQSAHCENGVTANLLRHNGYDFINEPLVFGLGSGIFYIHIPFLKMNGGPAISFRSMPGSIFKRTCKVLGAKSTHKRFSNPNKAQEYLDSKIKAGNIVGCQVGVFDLPYFPPEYRFHFNAHNIIVYDKQNDIYNVSDPVMEGITSLNSEELNKVRFSHGFLAPKGHIYFPTNVPELNDQIIRKAIIRSIKRTTIQMLKLPGSFVGVKGIKYTSKKIKKILNKVGPRKTGVYLAQIVRMQEEIGTGGGGFRFIYAAFLEQATEYLNNNNLLNISDHLTKAGDLWRSCAVEMAGFYKGRLTTQNELNNIANLMCEISETEKMVFTQLAKTIR